MLGDSDRVGGVGMRPIAAAQAHTQPRGYVGQLWSEYPGRQEPFFIEPLTIGANDTLS
jgi:hypothetical protein